MDVMHKTATIDWTGVPLNVRAKFDRTMCARCVLGQPCPQPHPSAVCRSMQDCQDLAYFFGGDEVFCPYGPILLVMPGLETVMQVEGQGVTTIAELRDLCVTSWGRMEDRLLKNGGKMFDFAALREAAGLPQREEGDTRIREMMRDKAELHRRFSRTNPARDPMRASYPRQSWPTMENDAPPAAAEAFEKIQSKEQD